MIKKKSMVIALMIMVSLTSIANGTSSIGDAKAMVKVVPAGEMIRLYYAGVSSESVKLVIRDEEGDLVYREKINAGYSFQRAYNMSNLPFGTYEFQLITGQETISQLVDYVNQPEISLDFFVKSLDENGTRKMVRIPAGQIEKAKVTIYSNVNGMLYEEVESVENGMAKIYRLDNAKPGEKLEVEVKSIK
ncbi:hypothetical protein [Ekhidna sp.]|uniref:hypothetical protein n=1 Tax=Ekhidna sp. TaxID=2608089 RepID=UPI003B5004A1